MLNLVVLATLAALAAAKPGYLNSLPINIAEEFAYETAPYAAGPVAAASHGPGPIAAYGAAPVGVAHFGGAHLAAAPIALTPPISVAREPQNVTYTRTDVFSRKITASAPYSTTYLAGDHIKILENAVPHAVKNIHYAEENIVRGPAGVPQEESPQLEVNLRSLNIQIPDAQGVQLRSSQSQGPAGRQGGPQGRQQQGAEFRGAPQQTQQPQVQAQFQSDAQFSVLQNADQRQDQRDEQINQERGPGDRQQADQRLCQSSGALAVASQAVSAAGTDNTFCAFTVRPALNASRPSDPVTEVPKLYYDDRTFAKVHAAPDVNYVLTAAPASPENTVFYDFESPVSKIYYGIF